MIDPISDRATIKALKRLWACHAPRCVKRGVIQANGDTTCVLCDKVE